ncbi:MAG: hypothetical protein IKX24_03780 [Prevotella sp.]|nr:hypothetical protein [Prevotella sp.]
MALPSTGSDSGNVLVIVKDGDSGFKVTKNIHTCNYFVASLRLFCVNISLKSAFVATNATLLTPLNELFNNELREVWQRCNKN